MAQPVGQGHCPVAARLLAAKQEASVQSRRTAGRTGAPSSRSGARLSPGGRRNESSAWPTRTSDFRSCGGSAASSPRRPKPVIPRQVTSKRAGWFRISAPRPDRTAPAPAPDGPHTALPLVRAELRITALRTPVLACSPCAACDVRHPRSAAPGATARVSPARSPADADGAARETALAPPAVRDNGMKCTFSQSNVSPRRVASHARGGCLSTGGPDGRPRTREDG